MNEPLVEKIANALLYEGYMLYPYRASALKNRMRWNFGVLHPWGAPASEMQTEVLVESGSGCELRARVRFLWFGDTAGEEPEEREIELEGCPAVCSEALPGGGLAAAGMTAEPAGEGLLRVRVRVRNETPDAAWDITRRSMLSTHTILTVRGGAFVSLIDPPDAYREAAAACRNVGTWPVLAGSEGQRDTMLSSPIILYDYPRVAPESPGDWFDGAEIEELLALRTLTLSDAEKAEIRAGGPRARAVLERAEALPAEQLMKLHGAVRELRPEAGVPDVGDRVRLRPRKRADIFDLALEGKIAIVQAVEQDYEGSLHVAVTVEDDPGREWGEMRQPGHRFFFGLEEVEPMG